ncbi:NTP transferase domain-containing protein [Candidatus Kaiserbacteria bacterium]|nr:NTP transferase domain-containing protein [Candidatus Kaiserbacteria bacterium]
MQAVVLAAGLGTRMGEWTKTKPKSLVEIAGKTILEHKFDEFPEPIDELVLVIGHFGEQIRAKFGNVYKGKKITYVDCPNPVGGTMYALACARSVLHGRFLATNGDDIHLKGDIENCLQHEWALAIMQLADLGTASKVEIDASGKILNIVEADTHGGGAGLGGVGLYILDQRVFDVPPVVVRGRTETGLPQTMVAASKALGIPITTVKVSKVVHITTLRDVVAAEAEKIFG